MAGASVTAKNGAVGGVTALGAYISMHTADPGTTGASEVTGAPYARQQTTWAAASGGSQTGSAVTVPMPTGTGTVITYWGLWTAVSGGTWLDGYALSPSETYSTAGGSLVFTPTVTATG